MVAFGIKILLTTAIVTYVVSSARNSGRAARKIGGIKLEAPRALEVKAAQNVDYHRLG